MTEPLPPSACPALQPPARWPRRLRLLWAGLALCATASHAGLGLTTLPDSAPDGPVTLYYPTAADDLAVERGRFTLHVAVDAEPRRGNGRLVVISHGSGGAPWVHADLARHLAEAGYIVAMPTHKGDNYRDSGNPGPDSWDMRPAEVSRAIDAVGRDARFGPLLKLDKVGVYGGSAGGHTALSLAGGRWSPEGFRRHCDEHLDEDFQACVGLLTRLDGGLLDGPKRWLARTVIRWRFGGDDRPREHRDPRIAAVVAAVPYAADFDLTSLAEPRVPLGLVTARQDRWLTPRWHGEAVAQACRTCERIADFADGGHSVMLSPLPPGLSGLAGELLADPPGFDRATLPETDRRIVAFFGRHLP